MVRGATVAPMAWMRRVKTQVGWRLEKVTLDRSDNPLSPDVRFVQNGPSTDGWTPPARGRGTEEPTIGGPEGRGRGRRGGGGASK